MTRSIELSDNVQYVKGVGPARAELLKRLGVETVEQLLWLLPRDYVDLRQIRPIDQLVEDEACIVRGRLIGVDFRFTRVGVPIVEALIGEGASQLAVTWFHRRDLRDTLKVGEEVQLTGKPKSVDGIWRMTNPKVRPVNENTVTSGNIVPVYPTTEGLRPEDLKTYVQEVLPAADHLVDALPLSFRESKNLPSLAESIRSLHEPKDEHEIERARNRLIYGEFLEWQLALAIKRGRRQKQSGYRIKVSSEVDRRIRRLFPFPLTKGQDGAIAEIVNDLQGVSPMRRLLQGDVGSGKTAVAIYAMLGVIAAGYQAAFMAPTEILARQQFRVLDQYLSQSRVRRRLLTGSLSPAERSETLDALFRGDIDLIVGTHALVQKGVHFHRLGLVVIDEQHKFGVRQRAEMLAQDVPPHQLVMTATPIPRSLAMTWFGDLDLSTIREKPPGRKEPTTHLIPVPNRDQAYEFLATRARLGMLGIVVCPRIQGHDDLRGASDVFEEMRAGRFKDIPIGLVHGKMEEHAKDEVVRQFRRGDISVLVSTVVVEVGLDVPNASIVLIENAERFGLSQLHQIRGRVGRGDQPGICFLIHSAETPESRDRLLALAGTSDGFELAEFDAKLRGTGDTMGTRQHGRIRPRFGDFVEHADLLQQARDEANRIVSQDPSLSDKNWAAMRRSILRRFGKTFGIALVG
jgi:ATP-dependent DNA helicase RecG